MKIVALNTDAFSFRPCIEKITPPFGNPTCLLCLLLQPLNEGLCPWGSWGWWSLGAVFETWELLQSFDKLGEQGLNKIHRTVPKRSNSDSFRRRER